MAEQEAIEASDKNKPEVNGTNGEPSAEDILQEAGGYRQHQSINSISYTFNIIHTFSTYTLSTRALFTYTLSTHLSIYPFKWVFPHLIYSYHIYQPTWADVL